MTLPDTYPEDPPKNVCCPDLPPPCLANLHVSGENIEGKKSNKNYRLIDIYSNFVNNIKKYRPLRRMLRDLDENTWTLDPPEGPARQSLEYTYRRIALSKGVSVQVEINPEASDQLPGLKFLGSEEKVCHLRDILGRNLEKYDQDYTLVQNLERILEVEFPQKQDLMEVQVSYMAVIRELHHRPFREVFTYV